MKITKSGFYKTSEIGESEIIVGDNLAITLFDDLNTSLDMNIGKNSYVEFFGFSCNSTLDINIVQKSESSKLHFRYLIYSDKVNDNKIKIFSDIYSDKAVSDIKILSIAGDNGSINLDGIIKINKGIAGVKAKLIEENLFLGNLGNIKGIPTLLVESNDVEASHACKIERMSDDKLFYLRSRGVGKENAMRMMIEAKVFDLFKCLSMIDNKFYDELIERILEKIK